MGQKLGLCSVSCAPVTTIKHTVFRESFTEQRLEDQGMELTGTDFFRQVAYVEIWNLPALNELEEVDRAGDGQFSLERENTVGLFKPRSHSSWEAHCKQNISVF